MQFMPLVMTGMMAWFPSGLVLYWLTNTVLSIVQQWRVNQVVQAARSRALEGIARRAQCSRRVPYTTGVNAPDTIAAIATAAGPRAPSACFASPDPKCRASRARLLGALPAARRAHLCAFSRCATAGASTEGIALYFPAPASFTGEHVLELQGHGGALVMDLVLRRLLELGCRMARPGEFSERAFLNGKMDVAQAEAVADLIDAGTAAAARAAVRSMQGEFSAQIRALQALITRSAGPRRGGHRFPRRGDRFSCGRRLTERLARVFAAFDSITGGGAAGRAAARGPDRGDRRQAQRRQIQLAQSRSRAMTSPLSRPRPARRATCCASRCIWTACRLTSSTPPDCAAPPMWSKRRAFAARTARCGAPTGCCYVVDGSQPGADDAPTGGRSAARRAGDRDAQQNRSDRRRRRAPTSEAIAAGFI